MKRSALARSRDEARPGSQDDGLPVCGTAWRCLLACRHTVLSHVLTHARIPCARDAMRCNGVHESIRARETVCRSVRARGPYTRPASNAYRCVNAREWSPDSALAIVRLWRESVSTLCTRTCVRKRKIKRERAHVFSRVCVSGAACIRGRCTRAWAPLPPEPHSTSSYFSESLPPSSTCRPSRHTCVCVPWSSV